MDLEKVQELIEVYWMRGRCITRTCFERYLESRGLSWVLSELVSSENRSKPSLLARFIKKLSK